MVDVVVVAIAAATLPSSVAMPYAIAVLAILAVAGEYGSRRHLALSARLPRLVALLCLPGVALGLAWLEHDSRLAALVRVTPLTVALVVGGRLVTLPLLRRHRRRSHPPVRTLVVGSGEVATRLVERLRRCHDHGLEPVGIVDDEPCGPVSVPVLGMPCELLDVIEGHAIQRVIIAFGHLREMELVDVIRKCERTDVEIHVVPRFFELGTAVDGDHLEGISLVRLSRAALRPGSWRVKRVFDLAVAGVGAVLVAPVLLAIAVAVRCTSPGPVLYRQVRVGQKGRPIEILKFRTLHVDHDGETTWCADGDPKVTPIGAFLRRTSLDELPQLFNVLRGDMSLVGPRPERPFFVEQFRATVPRYDDRLRVPVGMTGLAQVHGLRGDTSIAERVWFDNRYIEHWSLWNDVVILLRTFVAVFRRPETSWQVTPEDSAHTVAGVAVVDLPRRLATADSPSDSMASNG